MGDRTNPGFRIDNSNPSDDSRLATLERGHMEMAIQMGKHELGMQYLANDVKRGFDELKAIMQPMSEKVIKLDDMLDSHEVFIKDQKELIKDAKKDEYQVKKDKAAFKRNVIKAVVLAACSGFGTYAWEHWVAKLFVH